MVVLGIDIGGAQIKAGMVDEAGAILAARTIETPGELDSLLLSLHDAIGWLTEATAQPAAVGVGCKGIIDPDSTRVELLPGTLHFLEGLRLSHLVGLPPDVPVFADNDARVALAGEMVWGAARGHENVIMLTLGQGVGGAVLAGGRLLRGHTGLAGNLGHLTVDPDGAQCACGNRGCLETVFSARAIEGEAWARCTAVAIPASPSCFASSRNWSPAAPSFKPRAKATTWPKASSRAPSAALAPRIAGLLHVFDPELVILGGHIADAGADLLVPLQEEVWRRSRGLLGREVPIVEQQVADKSGIVGAAGLVIAPRG